MKLRSRSWNTPALGLALAACLGMLAGCPSGGPITQTITGSIVSIDAAAETFTVSTTSGEVSFSYAGVDIFLPGDEDTASGTPANLAVGLNVTVAATLATNGNLTANRITVAQSGGGGGGTPTNLGEGSLIIPRNVLPLAVDGGPLSRNGNLATGSIDWFSFAGTAGTKYNILTRGNAPVVVSVYRAVTIGTQTAAAMLWTTDPTENIDVIFVENPAAKTTASAEAAWIPSFVAPADGTYFVSVQAAIVTVCIDCGLNIDLNGHAAGGFPHVITYHDVRSYSVEVSTVVGSDDAIELTVGDPADDPAFSLGAVTVSQGDWFFFEGEANQNYMIEFRPLNRTGDDALFARVYAPSGSIACEAIACTECKGTPFFSPVGATYLVHVTVEGDWIRDYVEWGQAEYMIRILTDDHGNSASLATPVILAEAPGDSVQVGGFLSSTDNDVFMFEMLPHRTYRVATSSNPEALIRVDVSLEDLALAPNGPWDRNNVDGIGNESALFQNTTDWPEYAVVSVAASERNDAFGLRMGEFYLNIFNDDHADKGAQTYDATPIAIGTQASGILWADVKRDNAPGEDPAVDDVHDSDLFAFTPALWPAWHRIDLRGASMLTVGGNATVEDDVSTRAVEVRDHYESINTSTPVRLLVEGPNMHRIGTPYTVDIEQEDHANRAASASRNEANAAVLASGLGVAGVLWGPPGDDDIFQFPALPNRTYKVSITGANGSTSLAGTDNLAAEYEITAPANDRAIAVRHAGDGTVANIVQVTLGQPTSADIDYTVRMDADDHADNEPTDAGEIAALTDIGTNPASGVLFKSDTDVFRFTALPNRTYKVSVTNASGATALSATNQIGLYPTANPDDYMRAVSVRHFEADPKTIFVPVVYVGDPGADDVDITYTVSVEPDDHVDTADINLPQTLEGLTQLGAQARTGTLFLGDVDAFLYTPAMGGGTVYEFTPENVNIVLLVNGILQVGNTYTHNGGDGEQVLVQVTRSAMAPEDEDVDYSITVNPQ